MVQLTVSGYSHVFQPPPLIEDVTSLHLLLSPEDRRLPHIQPNSASPRAVDKYRRSELQIAAVPTAKAADHLFQRPNEAVKIHRETESRGSVSFAN